MANDCTLKRTDNNTTCAVPIVLIAKADTDTGAKVFLSDLDTYQIHRAAHGVTTFEMRLGFLTAASAFSAFAWISAAPSTIKITGATAGTELAAVAAAWPSGFTPTTVSVDKAGPGWVIDTKMVA